MRGEVLTVLGWGVFFCNQGYFIRNVFRTPKLWNEFKMNLKENRKLRETNELRRWSPQRWLQINDGRERLNSKFENPKFVKL